MMNKKNLIRASLALIFVICVSFVASTSSSPKSEAILTDTLTTLQPKAQYLLEDQLITTILSRYHYKKFEVNDSLSTVIYKNYLDALDNGKNYFLQSDINEFDNYKFKFDNFLLEGKLQAFYDIFNRYLERLSTRINYIDTILLKEFDYSLNENLILNRDSSNWAANPQELNDLWRKRLKNDALNLKLAGKDWDFIKENLSKRYKNYSDILRQYNSEDVFQLAMNAFTNAIDPHTNYLSPINSENFKIDMSLSLEGIGARLMYEDGYTKVVEIIPGGPAYKSKKLHVNDRIVAVAQEEDGDFVDIIGWRTTDVVQLIRGPKNTIVRLQILPAELGLDATPVEIKLVRDKVKLEDQSASSKVIDINNNGIPYKIGVITIPKFYTDFEGKKNGDNTSSSTSVDVKNLLKKLESEKVDGVIVDLRSDGGGALNEAIDVSGLFIKKGPVVQVKQSDGRIEVGEDPDSDIVYDGPLAVLVNRFSASASEIFTGAIQDYGRGLIIGEKTYGKGTVQNMIDLNRLTSFKGDELGQLKVTIAKYYRINGTSTQKKGVSPDITLPSPVDPHEFGESSEQSALPWDQIKSLNFEKYGDLSNMISKLNTLSQDRIDNSNEFDQIKEDIKEYKLKKEKNYISLNEDIRKKEKEENDKNKLSQDENDDSVDLNSDSEVKDDKNEKPDTYLQESGMILTDMIRLKNELTKRN
jgi:carboxyl-terminal processing protease